MKIKPQESWNIIDSQKVKCWQTCPRKYMYQHLLGWERDINKSVNLVWGEAIHRGIAHIMNNKFTYDSLTEAINIGIEYYSKFIPMSEEVNYDPKNTENIAFVLSKYFTTYKDDSFKFRVVGTEIIGKCLIPTDDEPTIYTGRLDALVQNEKGQYFIIDHKTTTSSFTDTWVSQWQTSFQIQGYFVIGNSNMYDEMGNCLSGVIVNGIFINKKSINLHRITIKLNTNHQYNWIHHASNIITNIKQSTKKLNKNMSFKDIIKYFPQNTTNCVQFFKECDFLPFCSMGTHPLQIKYKDDAPVGFKQEFWNPEDVND